MKLHITFKKMASTEALKTHTAERSERLKKFLGDQGECAWTFYLEADTHVADIRVTAPHVDYFAQSKTADLYASIDDAVEKIEKQLRKHKEMVKDHLHRNRT